MERGFKTRCEEMSRLSACGDRFSCNSSACVRTNSRHTWIVAVWSVAELGLDESDLNQLIREDPDAWSAITVSASGREAIVVNPMHRGGRYSSDVMHELAHLLLGHQPSTMFFRRQWRCGTPWDTTAQLKRRQTGWPRHYCFLEKHSFGHRRD